MDNPFTAAFNPQAPVAERTDALAGLHRAHLPGDGEVLPADAVQELLAWVQEAELAKALVAYPSYAAQHGRAGMQSVGLDEFQARSQGEYWERPLTLTAEGLRSMVTQTPVLNAVILTRTRQVQRFCRICDSDTALPGFQVGHVDRKHSPSRAELEQMAVLNKVISHCGFEFSARRRKALRRDSFAQLMAKATRDSLVLDAVALELELKNTRDLGIDGLYAVDGATIRLCPEQGYRGDPDIYAVQVVNGQVRTAYRYEELIFEPRNPRSDVASAGYGFPEAELLVRVVTCFLNAMALNSNVFDKNSIPKGVLHLFGNFDSNDVAAFRRYFNNMVRGVNNTLNLPVLVSKDQASKVQFEKFGVDFNEMMFAKWMTFLTSLICAVYGMSPSEINFDSFSGGTASTLGGSDTAEKLAASKDSGLRPLLSYFENLFTDFVVTDFNPDWCFRWTGLDVENPAQRFELRKTVLTLNELRAEEGYQALATPLGEAPVDPALLGAWLHLQEAGADKGLAKSFPHHKGRPGLVGGSLPRGGAADKAARYAQDVKFDFGSANTQWVFKPPFRGAKPGVNGWLLVSGGADDRLKPDGGKGLPREGAAACGGGFKFGWGAFPKRGPLKPPSGGGGGIKTTNGTTDAPKTKPDPYEELPTISGSTNAPKTKPDPYEELPTISGSTNAPKTKPGTDNGLPSQIGESSGAPKTATDKGLPGKATESLPKAGTDKGLPATTEEPLDTPKPGLGNNGPGAKGPGPSLGDAAKVIQQLDKLANGQKSDDRTELKLPSSYIITSLAEAEQYFRDNLHGTWAVTVRRKNLPFKVIVDFKGDNINHAYTKAKIRGQSERVFDAQRAKLMMHIINVLDQNPEILSHGGRDIYIKNRLVIDDNKSNPVIDHYVVVLQWKNDRYQFLSAHPWDKAQYKANKQNYTLPKGIQGKKVANFSIPERLSKSSALSPDIAPGLEAVAQLFIRLCAEAAAS
ncbi:phage portal protein [Methylovulum psychrotolerans]|uniref:phage portal protein n=1 Tax=Methylovulum psychrotolerans TaxID=1704499 RepID=UPI001BFF7D26|nr:phage portal protein [Methylovulum psychrotolerans]MBT9100025.1 phage portal protein [Methylovulum psychrotolerans]